jgi:hypothetical protein
LPLAPPKRSNIKRFEIQRIQWLQRIGRAIGVRLWPAPRAIGVASVARSPSIALRKV